MKKRILSISLALFMVLGLLPITVQAANKVKGDWHCYDGAGFIKAIYIDDQPFVGGQEFEVGNTVKMTVESITNYRASYVNLMGKLYDFSESGNVTFTIPDKDFTLSISIESLGYVVKYHSDGRVSQEMCYDYGTMITIKHPSELYPPLEKPGYDFLGWTGSYSGTEVEYRPGDKILAEKKYDRSGKSLYALWEWNGLTVTLDANGGEINGAATADMNVGTDGKLATLPEPTRTNYSFDGWWTEKTIGKKVTLDTKYTQNTTIYAHWKKEPVSRVDFENFTVPVNGKTYTTDVKLDEDFPGEITRYVFTMFNRDLTGSDAYAGDNVAFVIYVDLNDGYKWASSKEAYLNGKKQDLIVHNDSMGTEYGFLWYFTIGYTDKIKITSQSPETVEYKNGETVNLFVNASGADSYQWQVYNVTSGPRPLYSPKNIDGATDSTYRFFKADKSLDGKMYRCKLTSSDGVVYSRDFTLKLVEGGGTGKKGDVNNDGNVNSVDKAILNRYLAGWEGYKEKILNWDAADINNDTNVNSVDKAILNRYLAGWEGYDSYFAN